MQKKKINPDSLVEYIQVMISGFKTKYNVSPASITVGPNEYMALCAFATKLKGGLGIERPMTLFNLPVNIIEMHGVELGIPIDIVPGFLSDIEVVKQ